MMNPPSIVFLAVSLLFAQGSFGQHQAARGIISRGTRSLRTTTKNFVVRDTKRLPQLNKVDGTTTTSTTAEPDADTNSGGTMAGPTIGSSRNGWDEITHNPGGTMADPTIGTTRNDWDQMTQIQPDDGSSSSLFEVGPAAGGLADLTQLSSGPSSSSSSSSSVIATDASSGAGSTGGNSSMTKPTNDMSNKPSQDTKGGYGKGGSFDHPMDVVSSGGGKGGKKGSYSYSKKRTKKHGKGGGGSQSNKSKKGYGEGGNGGSHTMSDATPDTSQTDADNSQTTNDTRTDTHSTMQNMVVIHSDTETGTTAGSETDGQPQTDSTQDDQTMGQAPVERRACGFPPQLNNFSVITKGNTTNLHSAWPGVSHGVAVGGTLSTSPGQVTFAGSFPSFALRLGSSDWNWGTMLTIGETAGKTLADFVDFSQLEYLATILQNFVGDGKQVLVRSSGGSFSRADIGTEEFPGFMQKDSILVVFNTMQPVELMEAEADIGFSMLAPFSTVTLRGNNVKMGGFIVAKELVDMRTGDESLQLGAVYDGPLVCGVR